MLRAAGRLTCRSANRGQRSIFIQAETSRGEEGKIVRILGLESSADDTCAAIVTSDRKILSNVVIRQQDLLEKWGGIHPYHATSRHQQNMAIALRQCLDDARLEVSDLDAVAYTRGPGMASCLASCSLAAKTLSAAYRKPLIGVHHMQAHALTVGLTEDKPPEFPYLTLLISGGHTLLLLASDPFDFDMLATTHDDSIGDAFDKVARWLDIPLAGASSGGAALENYAATAKDEELPDFPVGMAGSAEFSYSGLKSAVRRTIDANPEASVHERRRIAAAFQKAAAGQLEDKVLLALKSHPGVSSLVVSGGVASNGYLRQRLRQTLDDAGQSEMRLLFPPVGLCTDNAAMIAWAAFERYYRNLWDEPTSAIRPKWDIRTCGS